MKILFAFIIIPLLIMAQNDSTSASKREKLANEIYRLYQNFKPEEMDKAMKKYMKMLDADSEGIRTREASDYVFLWDLQCENNLRLGANYRNHALLDSAAALVDSFPDTLSSDDIASGKYDDIEDIAQWKYESYHKIADGYQTDGRRKDAARYFAAANKYRGDQEEVSPRESYLKYDPVEDSDEYLAIKDELEEKLYKYFKGERRGMGFCFMYWSKKEALLKSLYGIEWNSPGAMNPRVIFD